MKYRKAENEKWCCIPEENRAVVCQEEMQMDGWMDMGHPRRNFASLINERGPHTNGQEAEEKRTLLDKHFGKIPVDILNITGNYPNSESTRST
jgi:hypothetical protein